MMGMTQSAPAALARFPVTTALELRGMTVERDLGLAFGLVVRAAWVPSRRWARD